MGRKQTAFGTKIGEALDCSADWQTEAQDCDFYDNIGLMLNATSVTDNLGAFFVEVRCRKDENTYSPWTSLTLDVNPALSDADLVFGISLNQLPWDEFRVTFVAAGTVPDGVCDVWMTKKNIGA